MNIHTSRLELLKSLASKLHDTGDIENALTIIGAIAEIERLYKIAYPPKTYMPTKKG